MLIKFKAWKKTNDPEMFEDIRAIDFDKNIIIIGYKLSEYTTRIDEESLDNVELLQSTGLIDKKGIEIFDGDIINYKVEVESDNGSLYTLRELTGYIYKEGNCMWVKLNDYEIIPLWCLKDKNATINILGNIYEHPHLLEKE